jgi:hypothetical protein
LFATNNAWYAPELLPTFSFPFVGNLAVMDMQALGLGILQAFLLNGPGAFLEEAKGLAVGHGHPSH